MWDASIMPDESTKPVARWSQGGGPPAAASVGGPFGGHVATHHDGGGGGLQRARRRRGSGGALLRHYPDERYHAYDPKASHLADLDLDFTDGTPAHGTRRTW